MRAASVKRPMRRTVFMALFAALLLVPTAHATEGPIQDLLKDCADDGVLQGDYTPSELRKAQTQLPTDIDEYSDCRDVLSRAISAGASKSNNNSGGTNNDPGTSSGGTDPAPAATATPAPVAGTTTSTGKDPGVVVDPATKEDWDTIGRASAYGGNAVKVNGRPVSPGETRLAAQVGRNGVPVNLLVVMILLGAVAVAAFLPLIRRRVVARPSE
jgi:hypothetical protein